MVTQIFVLLLNLFLEIVKQAVVWFSIVPTACKDCHSNTKELRDLVELFTHIFSGMDRLRKQDDVKYIRSVFKGITVDIVYRDCHKFLLVPCRPCIRCKRNSASSLNMILQISLDTFLRFVKGCFKVTAKISSTRKSRFDRKVFNELSERWLINNSEREVILDNEVQEQ